MKKNKISIRKDKEGLKDPEVTQIAFTIEGENVMVLTREKFYWKGEEVADTQECYKRFCEFLKAHNF